MAVGGYGLQFQPGVPQNGDRTGNGSRGRLQEPVQVLSTRLPKFFGAQSIAPASLLQGQGGMGQPAARGNVVAQALAQLAGLPPSMQAPPSLPGMPPLPPSMQDPQRPPGGGYAGGLGIGSGGVGAGLGGVPTAPPPPPPIQPSPIGWSPIPPPAPPPPIPTPLIRPGDQPNDQPGPSPGGYGDWIRGERNLPGSPRPPLPEIGGDDIINVLARRMFR